MTWTWVAAVIGAKHGDDLAWWPWGVVIFGGIAAVTSLLITLALFKRRTNMRSFW